jgi:hypothetical protein
MYSIPILDKTVNPITELNNRRLREFNNIYKINLNDGLTKPLSYDNPTGVPIGAYSTVGLNNNPMNKIRQYLYSNNADPSEEQHTTYSEDLQYITDLYNNLPPLSDTEKQIDPYLRTPYSPAFRDELLKQNMNSKTNVDFNVSQDFVKEYQDSINNMHKEANMYSPTSNDTSSLAGLLKQQIRLQEVNNMLLQKQMGEDEKKMNRYKTKMANF